jgi:hypothetical protein
MKNGNPITKQFRNDIGVVDREYPLINIDFVEIDDVFGPKLITRLSKEWDIPVNFMFIWFTRRPFPL